MARGIPSLLVALIAATVGEAKGMRYVHNAPESALDHRYDYHWAILAAALERTRGRFGDYELTSAEFMTERRQRFELEHGTGEITVMFLGTTPEMERTLRPIRIPVDKGLGGYNVFLLRRERVSEFAGVRSLADLKPFRFGLGLGWIDVEILRASGLRVVTGSSYEGLFDMLNNGRFDVFLRAAVEVTEELKTRQQRYPDFIIERDTSLYYPMPMYFWFAKSAAGEDLARRAEEGMRTMIEDGTYDRIFSQYQDHKIVELDLMHRRVIKIPNPNLGPETPSQDSRVWFDPATYRPAGAPN